MEEKNHTTGLISRSFAERLVTDATAPRALVDHVRGRWIANAAFSQTCQEPSDLFVIDINVDDGDLLSILHKLPNEVLVPGELASLGQLQNGSDLIREVSETFTRNAPGYVDAIFAATEAEACSRAAHSLKSATSYLGARRLGLVCEILREACERRDETAMAFTRERVRLETEMVLNALSNWSDTSPAL